ncbi:hypothetical protein BDK51DRAFT_34678 [Blyttiomyces helicus]|uniref:AP2/ERF domain-containing protein n=1 Tax=Blyttiomyces helicus TaxID=388810 RepID=A0A4V1IQN2_9FUNG|nr:hypothetical protein BDK51DRAFT_34678 [Blyttiomyces helicus]|eukprot:RKO87147.1 hypothetical protein BDK51DRAFT_34678 [Blyttiomyces helicus]
MLDELEKAKEHLKILNEIVNEKDDARIQEIQNMEIERIEVPCKNGNGNEMAAFIRASKTGKNELIVLVDDEDWHDLKKYEWSLGKNKGYISGIVEGQRTSIRRYIMREKIKEHYENGGKTVEVDHKHQNKLDNRKENFRLVSSSSNNQNNPMNEGCSSEFIGINKPSDRRKYCAQISNGGVREHVGYYYTEYEAALAYDSRAIEIYGEGARVNFLIKYTSL